MRKHSLYVRLQWLALATSIAIVLAAPTHAERIKDIATVAGVRANQLVGYGLIVGLDGTGDQTSQAPFTIQTVSYTHLDVYKRQMY